MQVKYFLTSLLFFSLIFSACIDGSNTTETSSEKAEQKPPQLKEENVSYQVGNATMNSYVAYDANKEGQCPGIIVIPEWWGLNDYAKDRAKQLASLGYIAIAADMYGNGLTADNPDSAGKYAGPFYENPQMAKERMDAALQKLSSYPQTDTSNIAAIGYCFGGTQVLNYVKLGAPVKGIVSFHGDLRGVTPDKSKVKGAILVCHGNADPFVPTEQVTGFKKAMDSAGVAYSFVGYDSATHAFTNPAATAMGKKFNLPIAYNAKADTASWNEMKRFFEKIFK